MGQSTSNGVSLPASHHGAWSGPNRLWMMDPANPSRSTGTITVAERVLRYTWSHDGKNHSGAIELKGNPPHSRRLGRTASTRPIRSR